jgi:insertion element IS1 protein InsB
LGFEVGDRSELTCDKLYKKLACYKIKLFCTDNWEAYRIVIPEDKHIISKAETSYIEGINNITRCYLARFKRKSHTYSKSIDNIIFSLNLLFNKRNFKCILI